MSHHPAGDRDSGCIAPSLDLLSAGASNGGDTEGHEHPIATNTWWQSTNQGGPWSPKLQDIFDKAGMSLDDAANRVRVQGHKGPHPQEYHQAVFRRLSDATRDCASIQECRAVLINELRALAREIVRPGSKLNSLVTRT
ncbi:AHH domain-containing protein [Pyxidicoccus sp. 3LFB2]